MVWSCDFFVRHMTLEQWSGHVTSIVGYKMAANSPNLNVLRLLKQHSMIAERSKSILNEADFYHLRDDTISEAAGQ